jgi:hypothetical protein
LLNETISYTVDGDDVAWAAWIRFDLGPEVLDVAVYGPFRDASVVV